jgi:hypothetical protein
MEYNFKNVEKLIESNNFRAIVHNLQKVDLNEKDFKGESLFYKLLAKSPSRDIILTIAKRGNIDWKYTINDGSNYLHIIAYSKPSVLYDIEYISGISIDTKNNKGQTPSDIRKNMRKRKK